MFAIRPLTSEDDFLAISDIYEQSWKCAYQDIIPQDYLDSIPHGRWADQLQKSDMQSLVMLSDNKYIGTTSYCPSRFPEYAGYGEIVSIYFLPEYMGKGNGKALFSAAVSKLQEMGYPDIFLWVLEENQRARSFYEKNGFICSNVVREDVIGGKKVREIMYFNRWRNTNEQ